MSTISRCRFGRVHQDVVKNWFMVSHVIPSCVLVDKIVLIYIVGGVSPKVRNLSSSRALSSALSEAKRVVRLRNEVR